VHARRVAPAGDAAPAITLTMQPGGLAHRSRDAWPQA
jgi:hypothetical protein